MLFFISSDLGVLITKKFNRDKPRTVGYVVAYIESGGLIDKDGRFRVGDEVRSLRCNTGWLGTSVDFYSWGFRQFCQSGTPILHDRFSAAQADAQHFTTT